MDNERIREICLALPHVTETLNWGHHLVFWVGDRDIGGKMFAMTDLEGTGPAFCGFTAGRSGFTSCWRGTALSARPTWPERLGIDRTLGFPAAARGRGGTKAGARADLREAAGRTKTALALPEKERTKLIRDRKKLVRRG